MNNKRICSGLTAFAEVSGVSREQIRLLKTLRASAPLREITHIENHVNHVNPVKTETKKGIHP